MAAMPAMAQASSLSPPGAPETPMAPTSVPAASTVTPPAIMVAARQIAHAGLRRARSGRGDQFAGIGAEADCGPGLAGRGRHRVGAGEAVAQQHLRHAEAIHHRDRNLIALLLAIGKRGASERQREIDASSI